jgi:general L-amino acid transport system substrate-binding protein
MSETRKTAAILVADVCYNRVASVVKGAARTLDRPPDSFSRFQLSYHLRRRSTANLIMGRARGTVRFGRTAFRWALLTFALALTVGSSAFASSPTLDQVKARGSLICGVNEGLPGFSFVDNRGIWTGFDVDFCRAIAAAIFGDPNKVKLVPLSADARFQALRDGKIDVLSRNSTWTMGREADFGLTFVGVTYYDGQGFMAPRAMRINSALKLDGAKVCVQSGTTTIDNLADFFTSNGMTLQEVVSSSTDDAIKNYDAGQCSVLTSDLSQLYALRLRLSNPRDHVILPDVISKEPLGPVVRDSDLQWITVVKWVYFAMVNAEELGVSSKTINQALKSQKPEVMRLVGTSGDFGGEIGLSNDWAANVVRYVGNYGEVFERNLGSKTQLAIPRGLNQLWNSGGIQYAPPIR